MSQEDENYITPIFPLDSEEFQEGGASIRNVTQFLDSYSQKIIGNFKNGYTVGITNSLILPAITELLIRDKAKAIVPFKTFDDLKASKAVADSLKTAPFFFLNQFFTKTEAMDDLRIKSDPAYDEDKQLLLLEISVRLYVLIYLLLATGNSFCASGTKATGDVFFKDYFTKKKQADLKTLILGLKSRWVDAEIQVCLFGVPKDDPAFTGFADFEILCKILYDYALVIYLEGYHYPSDLIKKFQDSYYFSSMTEFVQEIEKKVAALPPPPVDDCVELKKILNDKTKVKDPKAITKDEQEAITKAEPKYTKDFITECFKKYPAGEYAFAPVAPPTKTDCEKIKDKLDEAGFVADKKSITDAEVAKLTAIDGKYTKEFVVECFKDTKLFPAGEYALAPVAPPTKSDCEKIKDKLDEAGFVADKKAITDAEVAKLTAIDEKYTKEFVADCLTKTDIFPAGEYALAVAAPPEDKCIAFKAVLADRSKVENPQLIKKEELDAITRENPEYTEEFLLNCLKNLELFPVDEYGLAFLPSASIKLNCQRIKDKLDEAGFVADKKSITDAEVAKLTAVDEKFTKEFVADCLTKTEIFPAGEYALEDPAAAAAASAASANKAAANRAAANAKRADLKLRIEAAKNEFETFAGNLPEIVGFINTLSNKLSGKGPSPSWAEDQDKIDAIEFAARSLPDLLPRIQSASPEEFKALYQQAVNVLKTILEKGQPLAEQYNTVAKQLLADQKAKYESDMPDTPAEAAEQVKFKLDYEKLVEYQRSLDEILAGLPDKTTRVGDLEKELAALKNTGASSGGRKRTRRAHRKTRRAKRSRNTRRKNRKA